MFFSRVQLDGERTSAAQLSRLVKGDQYLPHQLLWGLFSSGEGEDRDKTRPFLFRAMDDGAWPTFYLLSSAEPEDRNGYFRVSSKPFNPKLQTGMRLRFDLRANPVKRSRTGEGRQQRHDLVMDMKQNQNQGGEANDLSTLEFEAGYQWLSKRAADHGFSLSREHFAADSYRQHRIPRPGKRLPIRFSSLDLRGVLKVTDAERFQNALADGIGPAKSFGCGLLLIRPA